MKWNGAWACVLTFGLANPDWQEALVQHLVQHFVWQLEAAEEVASAHSAALGTLTEHCKLNTLGVRDGPVPGQVRQ